ncbi:hypothetical protein ACIRG5_42550 [Lentzea sp. NPDC102401]|uniref:hypothetical protein n=1 Tax=Lentzea sp. NPDC102401 TaxID=3364128 RepID=UPI00380C6DCE
MRHWTKTQLNDQYELLREQWNARLVSLPSDKLREIENFRSLAGIELRLADVVEAAADRKETTFLEFQALHQAARYRRSEAEYWRQQADKIVARLAGS